MYSRGLEALLYVPILKKKEKKEKTDCPTCTVRPHDNCYAPTFMGQGFLLSVGQGPCPQVRRTVIFFFFLFFIALKIGFTGSA